MVLKPGSDDGHTRYGNGIEAWMSDDGHTLCDDGQRYGKY